MRAELLEIAPKVLPYMAPTFDLLDRERRAGKRILFEGAQGALLDVDHGTYPYVTSSNTVAANAATGSGLGPRAIGYVLGIAKAYTTRVGGGPFPTELTDEIGARIGRIGKRVRHQHRPSAPLRLVRRRADAPDREDLRHRRRRADQARRARRLRRDQGLHPLHARRRSASTTCPPTPPRRARLQPVYETMPGWRDATSGARSWADLPAQAIKYVRRIEELIGAPVALLSTSPERDDTILVHDPFQD